MSSEIDPASDFNLPNPAYIQRAANRFREKLRPQEPVGLDFEINTDFLRCDDFLMGDVRVDGERHILFATPTQQDLFRRAKRWYLDGPFKVVRCPFVQLYSVHAFIQQDDAVKQVPLLYILMSRMRKVDYLAVFRHIKETLGDIRLRSIVMDFEAAVWSAVKVAFPMMDISGCYFHWAQAVMRKLANLGLRTSYCEKKGLYCYVQQLLALPFLPPGHIETAFGSLANKIPCPELRPLIDYLEATWIANSNWSIHQWSVFRQSIRTNNDCEGGHTKEILTLMKGLGQHYCPRFYVIAKTDTMSEDKVTEFESNKQSNHQHETYSIHKIPRSREVKQSWVTTVISTAVAILYSFPLVFKLRPEIVLCNGPGTCIPLCLAGLMLKLTTFGKTQIIYVESICRVQTLSLSAKILYYLADDIFVQWPGLQRLYPRTKYIGRLV